MDGSAQQTLEVTTSATRDANLGDRSARRAGLLSLGGILAALGTKGRSDHSC